MTSIYLSKIKKLKCTARFTASTIFFKKNPPRLRRRTVMFVGSLLSLCVYINMFMECKTYPGHSSVFRWSSDCFALLDASPLRTLPCKPLWPLSTLCTSWCKTLHSWSDHLRPHRSHPAKAENVVLWFMHKLEPEIHGCCIIMISTQWLVMPKWTKNHLSLLTLLIISPQFLPSLMSFPGYLKPGHFIYPRSKQKHQNDRSLLPG